MKTARLRAIPSVDKVLQVLGDTGLPQPVVVHAVRRHLQSLRLEKAVPAADVIVAAAGTQFQIREVQRGLGGAQHWASTWFWGGGRFATEVALTGRYFSAEEAAQFYASTFPDSYVEQVHRAPGDYPSGKKGDVLTVEFSVMGIPCIGLNGGPVFKHNEAFSFQVATADQAETDRYWNAIVGNGGQESACGWCKDRWGVSWQISPLALTQAVMGSDPAAAQRAFEAMMTMRKIDIAAIEAAVRG